MIDNLDKVSKLSKVLSEKFKSSSFDDNVKYQLIDLVDDLLIVWCNEESCFYTQILQSGASLDGINNYSNHIQTLILSKPPFWDVKNIKLSKTCLSVLLIGSEAIAVVELPKRWGNPSLFESGADVITCRVNYVGEDNFFISPSVKVVAVDWHPGSVDQLFIAILASDNYFRVYNANEPRFPEQAKLVSHHHPEGDSGSRLGVGEWPVAFSFGYPQSHSSLESDSENLTKESSNANDSFEKSKFERFAWPLYILFNTGDVYYAITSLYNRRPFFGRGLAGPLRVRPATTDNYGVDFCGMTVLLCSPPVLVLATTAGVMHHCVVMETAEDQEQKEDAKRTKDKDLAGRLEDLSLYPSPPVYLHVYESLRLTLSLTDAAKEKTTTQLSLLSDPNTPARYWVYHREGVHAVTLPLVQEFILDASKFSDSDYMCVTEHVVCTRAAECAETVAVLGLAVRYARASVAVVLLASGVIRNVRVASVGMEVKRESKSKPKDDGRDTKSSSTGSFESFIRSLLQRSSSQPALWSGGWPDAAPDAACLRMVESATTTLRQSYIEPQIRVREEIKKRQKLLEKQRSHLVASLDFVRKQQAAMTATSQRLEENYKSVVLKQKQIDQRLEAVMRNVVRALPALNRGEREMFTELKEMEEGGKAMAVKIGRAQEKKQWQETQMAESASSKTDFYGLNESSTALSSNQLSHLKGKLETESTKLSELIKIVKLMKKEVGI